MRGWINAIHLLLNLNERRQREQEQLIAGIKSQTHSIGEVDLLPIVLERLRLQSAGIEPDPEVEWLKRIAPLEGGCEVGVGGHLVHRIHDLEREQQQDRELLVQLVWTSLRLPFITPDLLLLIDTCRHQPWYYELSESMGQGHERAGGDSLTDPPSPEDRR